MHRDGTFPMIAAMLFLSLMRREAARALLATIARGITVDALPARSRRSRKQHLRNGIGAMLDVSSQVAWRPGLLATLLHARREAVRSELRYGLGELRLAGAMPSRGDSRRHGLVLVAIPSAAAALALAARARRNAGLDPASASRPPGLAGDEE
jgi:hypothetical protein